MALVGTLLFCTACGNLLERKPPDTKMLQCGVCLTENGSMLDSGRMNFFFYLEIAFVVSLDSRKQSTYRPHSGTKMIHVRFYTKR